jgi:acetyltransferase-like isoleucine patch superfamily enzyme
MKFSKYWSKFWLNYAGINRFGRFSAWMAGIFLPTYYGRVPLSRMNKKGFVSPKATLSHSSLRLGENIYIDDNVLIYQDKEGGPVEIENGAKIFRETIIQTGQSGSIKIGSFTHIQPRCQLSAYKSPISIGKRVEIAPNCAFYPYNHGVMAGEPVRNQPLQTKGGIVIEDDVWLSYGVIILDGVRIGEGAVVGAGAVVTQDLPANSISSGAPARVIKLREPFKTA